MSDQLIESLGLSGGLLAVFLGSFWLLNRSLAAKLRTESEKQIAAAKHEFSGQLEAAKHSLQLEHARQSIVFEHQRTSFAEVLTILGETVRELLARYDPRNETWLTISSSTYDTLQRKLDAHALFLGEEGEHAVSVFKDVLSAFMLDEDDPDPDAGLSRKECLFAFDQLDLIRDGLANYFRVRVGIGSQEDPLNSIELLRACRLLARYQFPDGGFPSQAIRMTADMSAREVVDSAGDRLNVLCGELRRFIQHLDSNPRSRSFFYDARQEAQYCLRQIEARLPPAS